MAFLALSNLLVLPQLVLAHQFSVADGTVVVHKDRVEVEIEFSGEDLRHFAKSPELPSDGSLDAWVTKAAATMLDYLRDHLHVRTASGERLEIKSASTHITGLSQADRPDSPLRTVRVRQSLTYALDAMPNFLSFEHLPGDELGGLRMQWTLAGRFADAPEESLLRLTSGGNADFLLRDASVYDSLMLREAQLHETNFRLKGELSVSGIFCDHVHDTRYLSAFARARLGKDRFSTPYALVDVQGWCVDVTISIPTALVGTLAMDDPSNGVIELGEADQRALVKLAESQLAQKFKVLEGGLELREYTQSACVLPPEAMTCGEVASWTRISRLAGRCNVTKRYSRSFSDFPLGLRCELFNGLVLSALVFVRHEDQLSEYEISSFAPTVELVAGKR